MTSADQAVIAAIRLAKSAALAKTGPSSCPYPAGGTHLQEAARRAWMRTYRRYRPADAAPVDYSDDLTALAAGPDTPDTGDPTQPQADLFTGEQVGTAESGQTVDDAGDVILEAGWVPPVPNVLLDLREAGRDRKLRAYWVHGAGSLKIRWGEENDFYRCVDHLAKYVSRPEGLCNEYHKAALGVYPGQEGKKGKSKK